MEKSIFLFFFLALLSTRELSAQKGQDKFTLRNESDYNITAIVNYGEGKQLTTEKGVIGKDSEMQFSLPLDMVIIDISYVRENKVISLMLNQIVTKNEKVIISNRVLKKLEKPERKRRDN